MWHVATRAILTSPPCWTWPRLAGAFLFGPHGPGAGDNAQGAEPLRFPVAFAVRAAIVGGRFPPCRRGGKARTVQPQTEDIMYLSKLPLAAALVFGLAGTTASAQDIAYQLINNTSGTLLEFYTSPVDVDNWEFDLLADFDLEPGADATVNIGDGRTQCDYDLLFVFDDGSQYTDTVDICQLSSYELVE
jgi:hypothetical protein